MALFFRSWVEDRAGDLDALERVLRAATEEQRMLGARSYRLTAMGHLALCLYERGRFDEARSLSRTVRAETAPGDLANVVFVDALDGTLLAHEGRIPEARETARRALEQLGRSDFYFMRALTLLHVAEVESIAGDGREAARHASEAVSLSDAKGDVSLAVRLRRRFAELGIEAG